MKNRGLSVFIILFRKAFGRNNPPVSVSEMQDFTPLNKTAPTVVFDTGEYDRPTTRVVRGRPDTSRLRKIHQPSRGRGHRQQPSHRKVK